ncbi:MAG TPA: adenylate/guanylate cyclase domain-containing protein [Solirubrobacteraceae bacterium]|nr:adenylate/guanylate cyclase domain-containing protein [Solirubrobacteraceae bacterium]
MEASADRTSIDVIASALEPLTPAVSRLSSPDGALTLMLSDIADAPAIARRLGPDRWEQLLSDHHLLVERLVAHHDGQVVKFERDGFLASFNSAHGGLHAALEMQRTFSGGADGDAAAVRVRIGLHSGFVIAASDALLGRNVVLASRIAGHAKSGEILVSSNVREYTESDPSFRFEPRGEHHFKGLLGEHELYCVPWREDSALATG